MMALSRRRPLIYAPSQTGMTDLAPVTRSASSRDCQSRRDHRRTPRVSPDGTRVVLEHAADSLWLQDLSRDAAHAAHRGSPPRPRIPDLGA